MSDVTLTLPAHIEVLLRAEAQKQRPNEACGYLAGKAGLVHEFYPMTNADASPEHFTMVPQEQFAAVKAMRAKGQDMLAVWHSHPDTPARMSEEDLRLAYMPGIIHVILSLAVPEAQSLRGFQVFDNIPHEIQIQRTEEA
jgi:proteasome lid subunit RPN8/RPN11